ncbi:type III secretion protein N (ATPase) [Bradyrhizobium sp. USDA 4524]|uniref:FliI/YscN family ATPase n=1 Tax=unclassified Bradyrhizobium TaxID=2631580 RepID=UPI00273A62F3|nr:MULTISPECIES: FliI/YscN family ATPase [unclassified Bradyrhizobium]MCP1846091.1 type III secretion protein N (ATPase) [Bradyrhizobium sp. USDA 4538]MCP1907275.1 type III secretion protein N (ATPase) [Bradyrhizobium sp. USDA 4537]MCP1985750.1 type III secretion protein N (ATPase) [Bradyrhizobium sp. USDA 4539]
MQHEVHRSFSEDALAREPRMASPFRRRGRVLKTVGPLISAAGNFGIGEVCAISRMNQESVLAEVVGFEAGSALLTPYGRTIGISHNSTIQSVMSEYEVPVGDSLVGRVLDALGQPIDGRAPLGPTERTPGNRMPPNPMSRPLIDRHFALGVRALDGALTCGEGQRMGIFAAAGGGKSTLISILVRNAQYDRCVMALIGERGREVREFIDRQLGPDGMARSVIVAATSDRPAIEQVKAAYTATAIAEYHRDRGEKVLLIMDSLTRFARAQRQIGLSAGEPPTRRGFPPSVFEQLPILVERAGKTEHGSITAFYTVLVEGDDMNEPVADEVRSLLDGHIILSRKLGSSGHYPAIDVGASASRILTNIVTSDHREAIRVLRTLLAKYNEIELLIRIGEYTTGSDPEADEAIRRKPVLDAFLRQAPCEFSSFEDTIAALKRAVGHG